METFFIIYLVAPKEFHELNLKREELYAYCWIKAFNNEHAINVSKFLQIVATPVISLKKETKNLAFNIEKMKKEMEELMRQFPIDGNYKKN